MISLPNFEYLPQILEADATAERAEVVAKRLQTLTVQDMELGGFKEVWKTADPSNPAKVDTQKTNLRDYPQKYSGYQQENGLIVAYMKTNEWFRGDEAAFAASAFKKAAFNLKKGPMDPRAFGVLGLVVDRELELDDQHEILHDLLYRAMAKAAIDEFKFINIIIHDKDPVLEIAKSLEFKPVGPRGIAVGAPGLEQQRYQRPAA